MFAAPPSVQAQVFATIPAEFGRGAQRSHWGDIQFPGAPTPTFLEGPSFDTEGNLWVTDIATGAETQLTKDGVVDFGYATNNAGWVHNDQPVLTWSPDGQAIATFQHDGRGVRDMVLTGTQPGAPTVEKWKYPLPGDSLIFRIERVIIRLENGIPEVVRLKMEPDAHRSTVSDHVACDDGAVCDLQWYPDGSHVAFISSSRDHKHAWLRIADARTGEVREVLHEESKTQIGDASLPENLWRILPRKNEFIWWSERDNWVQLYLYDLTTGQLKNRITSGEGNVTRIVRVDEKARQVWFTMNGHEPGRDRVQRDHVGGDALAVALGEHAPVSIADLGRSGESGPQRRRRGLHAPRRRGGESEHSAAERGQGERARSWAHGATRSAPGVPSPETSGSYISSACVGRIWNSPSAITCAV